MAQQRRPSQVDATDAAANKTSTRATKSAPLGAGDRSASIDFAPHLLFPRLPIDPASVRCWLYGHATAVSGSLATQVRQEGVAEPRVAGRVQLCSVPAAEAPRLAQASHVVLATLAEPVPSSAGEVLVTCTVDQSRRACPAH